LFVNNFLPEHNYKNSLTPTEQASKCALETIIKKKCFLKNKKCGSEKY
jgi:hypothetical protein